jgi:type IV secretory pathway VirB2 component (pilin)
MKALIIGVIVITAAVIACIPAGLGWWDEVLVFLRGCLPVLLFFIGLIALFMGIVDIKDRITAAKNEEEAK